MTAIKGVVSLRKHFLDRGQSLLMIIDLQERLMAVMDQAQKVYRNTCLMLAVCQQLEMPVVVTEQYPRGLGRTVPDISEKLGQYLLIEKITFSAVTAEMLAQLQELGRKQILVAGSETHVCVFQTVRDLVAVGYEVYLLQDAVCSRRKRNYKNGLQLMKEEGAILTDTETAVFDLLKKGDTPGFRAILAQLKQLSGHRK